MYICRSSVEIEGERESKTCRSVRLFVWSINCNQESHLVFCFQAEDIQLQIVVCMNMQLSRHARVKTGDGRDGKSSRLESGDGNWGSRTKIRLRG